MIWIPKNLEQDRQEALVTHLAATISEHCGLDAGYDSTAVEIATAVSTFLEQHMQPGQAVESGYLVLLATQAVASLGNAESARRLMIFGSGLVRPAEWEVTGGRDIWTLDLRRMMVTESAPIELLFFNALGMIVEAVAEVWDASDGDGVLGLRHVYTSAVALLGGGSEKKVNAIAQEIQSVCKGRLERACQERGWQQMPAIMNLDL